MNALLEKYRAATERWFQAPSGMEYRIHGMTAAEFGIGFKAIPSLAPKSNGSGEPHEPDAAEINGRLAAIFACGVSAMRWQGEETTEIPPIDEIPTCDAIPLVEEITKATGLVGKEADELRGVL